MRRALHTCVLVATTLGCAGAPRTETHPNPRWISIQVWREHTPTSQVPYRTPLCWKVSLDCGDHGTFRGPTLFRPGPGEETTHCETRPGEPDARDWLRASRGGWEVRWPERCLGRVVEVYLSVQPGADCAPLHDHYAEASRDRPVANYVLQCEEEPHLARVEVSRAPPRVIR